MNLKEKWDKSHQRIPKDKSVSSYAVEKEQNFPRNSIVLDLGGGTGVDAIYFASKGHTVTLADISDYALNMAKKKALEQNQALKTAQVTLGSEDLPFEENTYDIVYSRLALHYFDISTTRNILNNINKVLKVGGRSYLTLKSPNDESEMEFLKSNANEREENVFDEDCVIKSRYTVAQLENMLKDLNIRSFSVKEYVEVLGGRVDVVKSGNKQLLLNEIMWEKN